MDPGWQEDDDKVVALPVAAPTEEEVGGPVPPELLVPAIEACLFAVGEVCTVARLAEALGAPVVAIEGGLEVLGARLARGGSGLRLVPVGAGWQLRTEPRFATWVAAARGGKPVRLSRAAVETLAVIAYRQPVSKGSVDDIRGVDSGGVLRALSDRGLVRVLGRSEEPGRPLTWGTTPAFLELFGMRSVADLPTLRELRQVDDDALEGAVVAPSAVGPSGVAPSGGAPSGVAEAAVRRLGEVLGPPRLVVNHEVAEREPEP